MSMQKIIIISNNLSIQISSDMSEAKAILGLTKYTSMFPSRMLPTIEQAKDEASGNSEDVIRRYEAFLEKNGQELLLDVRSALRNMLSNEIRWGHVTLSETELESLRSSGVLYERGVLSSEEFEKLKEAGVLLTNANFNNVLEEFLPKNQLAARDLSKIDEVIVGCWRVKDLSELRVKMPIESKSGRVQWYFSVPFGSKKSCCDKMHTEQNKLILGIDDAGGGLDIIEFDLLKIENLEVLANALGRKVKKFSDHTGMLYSHLS